MSDSDSSDVSSEEYESDSEDSETGSTKSEVEEDPNPVPKDIKNIDPFTDISFHPELPKSLVAADLSGYVRIYQCDSAASCVEKAKIHISTKPCRCISHSNDGDEIYALTKNKTLHTLCSYTGKIKQKITAAHESPPYSLCVINKNLLASGDEEGVLKIWDLRRGKKPVMIANDFEDYISDIVTDDKERFLFAVSGDGTMSTFNIRLKKSIVKSMQEKQDLLCAQVMKNNSKLAVGCATGFTLLYHWEQFAAPSDRFPGHRGTIDCMVKISEDILCTGSSDGMIRAVRIIPNRYIGVVGKHRGFPIEKIRVNSDGDWLASVSHDSKIRFWPVDYLHRVKLSLNKKAEKSRSFLRIDRNGVVNRKAQFISDIEKEMEVPVCDVDSDDATTSEEEEEAD